MECNLAAPSHLRLADMDVTKLGADGIWQAGVAGVPLQTPSYTHVYHPDTRLWSWQKQRLIITQDMLFLCRPRSGIYKEVTNIDTIRCRPRKTAYAREGA